MIAWLRPAAWLPLLVAGIGASFYVLGLGPTGSGDGHGHGVGPQPLFNLPAAEFAAVEIVAAGRMTRFERDAEGGWFLHAHDGAAEGPAGHTHTTDAADAERLEKAFQLLANARSDRIVAGGWLQALQRTGYGLTHPPLIALIYRRGRAQPELTLEFGDLTPDGFGRYVLVPQRQVILQLPDYQAANLRALVDGPAQP
jgi:hypothetical protein